MTTDLRDEVRNHYALAALGGACGCGDGGCCGDDRDADARFGKELYEAPERTGVLADSAGASLGCGNPLAVAELHEGETVLDLGSGGGLDVLLSARRVGPSGTVYGLDMTEEMLALARRNAVNAGATNVHFLKGLIEAIPLPAESVDVVVSNCVVNLSTEKPAVFAEIARVLRPDGRVGIADIVAEDHLSDDERAEGGSHVGCIAGALSEREYREGLERVGLVDVDVRFTHRVADGMHSAVVRARKPSQ